MTYHSVQNRVSLSTVLSRPGQHHTSDLKRKTSSALCTRRIRAEHFHSPCRWILVVSYTQGKAKEGQVT